MGLENRVPRKTQSRALAALLHMLKESHSGSANAVIKWGGKKREKKYNSCDSVSLQGSRANSSICRDLGT